MGVSYFSARNTWRVTHQLHGKRVFYSFKTEEEAQAKWRELNPEGWQGESTGLLLDEARAMIDGMKHRKPRQTILSWENSYRRIKEHLGNPAVSAVDPEMIRRYQVVRLGHGVSKATVNREVFFVSRVITHCVSKGSLVTNKIQGVRDLSLPEPKGKIDYLTLQEVRALIDACDDPLKAQIEIAVFTGMRLMEVLSLSRKRIDLDRGVAYLWRKHKKNYMPVPLSTPARDAIKRLPDEGEWLFPARVLDDPTRCEHVTSNKTAFNKAVARANLKISFHALRHTFASHAVMNGMDLRTLQEVLGHATLDMVMRYAHLGDQHKADAMESVGLRLRGENEGCTQKVCTEPIKKKSRCSVNY